MTYTLILIAVAALALFAMIAALVSRYKRCPSDKLLVVYGRTNGGTAKVYHGGGTFIWPVIQDYAWLDLKPMAIDIDLRGALTSQNIRIDVPSTFTVAVSSENGVMKNAAERLLGLQRQDIAGLAKDIIFGQLRLVIATMTVEEINADRDKFLTGIQENLEAELAKIGLHLVNVNITDIHDESGYIQALGKEAAAKAINDAKVSVSQKTRDGAIGEAEAQKEQRIKTSELHSAAQVGEAEAQSKAQIGQAEASSRAEIGAKDAESKQRIKTSELNAQAVTGENEAAKNIANSTADREVVEAEATRKATTARNVAVAKAKEDSYAAEREAENARAAKEKATQVADIVVPAQVEKERIEIEAAAEANRTREIAKGQADAKFAEMEALARGDYERLSKQAEGFAEIVKAAGGDPDKAVQLMITDKLDELMRIQVEAIQNIKIDSITVWDQGSNGSGQGSTAGFLKDVLTFVPGFEEVYKMAGKELPAILQGAGTKLEAEIKAAKTENNSESEDFTDAEEV